MVRSIKRRLLMNFKQISTSQSRCILTLQRSFNSTFYESKVLVMSPKTYRNCLKRREQSFILLLGSIVSGPTVPTGPRRIIAKTVPHRRYKYGAPTRVLWKTSVQLYFYLCFCWGQPPLLFHCLVLVRFRLCLLTNWYCKAEKLEFYNNENDHLQPPKRPSKPRKS
jgi:hypothetical protein